MSEILLERLRSGGGSWFLEGGSRKGGFVRTPRTPPGYGPGILELYSCGNIQEVHLKVS